MEDDKQEAKAPEHVFLVDNGSLRPDATRNLRRVADLLTKRSGRRVRAVSLLHSHKVAAEALDGRAAEIFEPAVTAHAERGAREFLVLPFFFGPSRALTDFIPARVNRLKRLFPNLRVRMAPPLVDSVPGDEERVASLLCEGVLTRLQPESRPAVALVDHGSPAPEVTEVRDRVAARLGEFLGDRVSRVAASSMERREGERYRFNEPLLERLLGSPGFDRGPVIVSMMFLSPGRHAGPGGDVATICAEAERAHPGLKTVMTPLAGEHDGILDILVDRLRDETRTVEF